MDRYSDKPFLCTYEGCERGMTGNGFLRHWSLRDHMKRVHGDPGQLRYNSPPPRPSMAKNRTAGEQDNLYANRASSVGVVSQPPEPSLIDQYSEKQKGLIDTIKQVQDPRNVGNMALLRSAADYLKVMAQTTQRIHSAPS